MNISFSEFKPSLELARYIETYWIGDFNIREDSNFSQNVMPNGCIELIIHLSEDHCALNKGGKEFSKSPPFTLLGLYPELYTVKFKTKVTVFGVRFYPDGFRNIFGVPSSKILSTYENGVDVVGNNLKDFCSHVREAVDIDGKINLVNRFLTKQLLKNQREFDYTHLAMSLIRQRQGLLSFDEIEDRIPISLRQLQRGFKDYHGLTITDYIRLSRLNAINKYMLQYPSKFTGLAYDLKFADQSHFIKEFKHYTGLSPRRFVKQKNHFIINAV